MPAHRFRAARFVFANLIAKEVVNGIKGGRVVCLDHDACSSRQFLIGVVDFFVQALYSVSKSHAVLRVVGLNLDGAAIGLFVVLHSCQKKQI